MNIDTQLNIVKRGGQVRDLMIGGQGALHYYLSIPEMSPLV